VDTEQDLLTEAIESLRVNSSATIFFEFSEPWGFKADFRHPFCWSLLEGRAWIVAPGQEPLCLEEGDSVILPRGTASGAYLFLSGPDAHPYPVEDFWRVSELPTFDPVRRSTMPSHVRWGGLGPKVTRVVSLAFGFQDVRLTPMIEALPERMVVRTSEVDRVFLQPLLAYPFGNEDRHSGFPAIVSMTAHLLLMYLVRAYLLRREEHGKSWLGGLADPRIARALTAMHRTPRERWSVERLAEVACMSRAAFAKRFYQCTGQSPARYLCVWRMQLARHGLGAGKSIKELACELGYQSEAAFRAAFRRTTGQPPKAFQRTARV
jgi:AraC-like DNA-binding protein